MGSTRAGADSGRRALELLFAFTEQRPVASVRELAERLDIPVPSVHRYVALLRDMGLVEEGMRGQYQLTMRVAALGRAARRAAPLVNIAEPYLRELAQRVRETVVLSRLVRGLPVCVHVIEAPHPLRLSFDVGQGLPPLRGASVRLLLGALNPVERQRYVAEALAAGARPPVRPAREFLAEVERDVTRGWAISNQEIDEGVWAAAAAITEDGRTRAVVAVPCPATRLDEQRRAAILDLVCVTAAQISRELEP